MFTFFRKTTSCIFLFLLLGTVEVINARETTPQTFPRDLLSSCNAGFPIGKDTAWATAVCPPGVHRAQGGELSTSLT